MKQKLRNGLRSFFSPDSLRVQLLSRSLLIMAILLVLIGLFQYIFMRDVIFKNKATSLQSQIIPPPVLQHFDTIPDNDSSEPPRIFIPDASLVFIDASGNYSVLSYGPDNINPPRLDTQEYLAAMDNQSSKPAHPSLDYRVIDSGGEEQLVVIKSLADGPGHMQGVIQLSTPTAPLKELLIGQLLMFFFLALIALLFGLLGFLPVLKKTLVPLSNMVDTAEQIDAGNLDMRFTTSQGQTEIDRLAESFNGMMSRLEASFEAERETQEQMRRFIADASHELRTPLTSIYGFLEVLLRGAANQPDQLEKSLKSMHSESQRLNKLVADLILLSKLDRMPHVELTEGALEGVLRDMEPQLRILAGSRQLTFTIEPTLKCNYDTDQMKQVILNLFQNAVQHTDSEKGHLQISLKNKDNGVQLAIQDNGPGISDDHLPHVFERFYRSDSSRTRKYGGAGLGLSITKSIVDAHHGLIWVECQEGQGCTFYVWLPQ
ncbi:MAG TPA: ATP-binding protein [Syntrophomonadaceae bacterium]|nr:ATP-binding protein [Syntrophomonadaceae bacterium]